MKRVIHYYKTRSESQLLGLCTAYFISISLAKLLFDYLYKEVGFFTIEFTPIMFYLMSNLPFFICVCVRLLNNKNVTKWIVAIPLALGTSALVVLLSETI